MIKVIMPAAKNSSPYIGRTLTRGHVTWIDVVNPSADVFAQLETAYQLHPVHLKESVQQVQHSRVEREDQYLFFVLHIPVEVHNGAKISIRQVGVFLGKDFLVTICNGAIPAVTELYEQCERSAEHTADYFKHGSAYLVYIMISNVLNNIFDMTESVSNELDSLEDLVFGNRTSDAQKIGKVRQKIVRLRRVIGPKKMLFEDLAQQVDAFSKQSMSKYFSNNTKTVSKLWEVIEEAKETVEIYKDVDFTTSTEQTNRILAILTLVFTFTIPVTVLGTLYGMNVPLPGGVTARSWTFFGTFTTFGIVLAFSTMMALGMYLYFKHKKWF